MVYIGRNDIGTNEFGTNAPNSSRFVAASSFTAKAMTVYLTGSTSGTFTCAIYADDGSGYPGSKLVSSATASYPGVAGWYTVSIADTNIVNGTAYHLALWVSTFYIHFKANGVATMYRRTGLSYPTWPSPFNQNGSASNGPFSIYASEVSGATQSLSDSISFAESLVKKVGKKPSDSQSFAESLVSVKTYHKSLSDSQTFVESIAKKATTPLSDSQSISESLIIKPVLKITDAITFSEAMASVKAFKRYFTYGDDRLLIWDGVGSQLYNAETSAITFAESLMLKLGKKPSDSLSISEVLAKRIIKPSLTDSLDTILDSKTIRVRKYLSEFITLAETITRKAIRKYLFDSITIVESEVAPLGHHQTLSDSISIAEINTFKIVKKPSDPCELFEEIAKLVKIPLADSLIISEGISNGIKLYFTESVGITVSLITTGLQTLEDTLNILEQLNKNIVKNLSDELLISESYEVGKFVYLIDSLSLSEELAKLIDSSQEDSITFADTLSRVVFYKRELEEAIEINEETRFNISVVLADTVDIADTEIEKPTIVLSDTITFSEEITQAITKVITDSLVITDGLGIKFSLQLLDSMEVSESIAELLVNQRNFTESVDISESLTIYIQANKAETVAIAETLGNSITLSLSDSQDITESETELTGVAGLIDSISFAESLTIQFVKGLTETVNIAEEFQAVGNHYLELSDSEDIDESIAKVSQVNFEDGVAIGETLASQATLRLSDSQSISESFDRIVVFYKEFSDNIEIVDTIGKRELMRFFTDSLTISESIVKAPKKPLLDSLTIEEIAITSEKVLSRLGVISFLRTDI